VSTRTVIEAAKEAVSTIDLANLLCGPDRMRRVGRNWIARCPLPDHEDRSPSFTVYPETDSFFCYGCLRGGDVIELARFAWGYEKREAKMAAACLLLEFGHPIPERPASWFRKLQRQQPIRNGIEAAKILAARQRLYKRFFEPVILATYDAEDRAHDAQLFWEATGPLAEHLVANMMKAGTDG